MSTDGLVVEGRGRALLGLAVAATRSGRVILRSNAPAMQVVRFVSHYVQMSIAMMVGMLLPAGLALSALGFSHLTRASEGYAFLMTGQMLLGMTVWMCIRRHSWRHTVEMSAGMAASTVVAAIASLAGLLPHTAASSTPVSILMWAGMLAAMIFRWREYAQYGHCHGVQDRVHPGDMSWTRPGDSPRSRRRGVSSDEIAPAEAGDSISAVSG